ncbi:unnamed protein product [Lota lota]
MRRRREGAEEIQEARWAGGSGAVAAKAVVLEAETAAVAETETAVVLEAETAAVAAETVEAEAETAVVLEAEMAELTAEKAEGILAEETAVEDSMRDTSLEGEIVDNSEEEQETAVKRWMRETETENVGGRRETEKADVSRREKGGERSDVQQTEKGGDVDDGSSDGAGDGDFLITIVDDIREEMEQAGGVEEQREMEDVCRVEKEGVKETEVVEGKRRSADSMQAGNVADRGAKEQRPPSGETMKDEESEEVSDMDTTVAQRLRGKRKAVKGKVHSERIKGSRSGM